MEHLTGRWERTGILLEKGLTILGWWWGETRVPKRHLGTVVKDLFYIKKILLDRGCSPVGRVLA